MTTPTTPTKITAPAVHTFDSTGEAYDTTQTDDSINDGDVLLIPSEDVAGFLFKAWPVAITPEHGAFHALDTDADVTRLGKRNEKRLPLWIHPKDAEPYETIEVFSADAGTDYTASIALAWDASIKAAPNFADAQDRIEQAVAAGVDFTFLNNRTGATMTKPNTPAAPAVETDVVKPTETKETVVPATAEKPAAKKSTARKPAAKKGAVAKKSVAKKPAAKKSTAAAKPTAKKAAAKKPARKSAYAPEITEAVKLAVEARGTRNGAPGPKQHAAVRNAVSALIEGDVTAQSLLKWLDISQNKLLQAASGSMATDELRKIECFRRVQSLDALQDPKLRPWVGGRNGASILAAWVAQLKSAK
jgi:hypothetical protein